ncbi:hypothetical protein RRSWK_02360 [Rhodopirellula sp. SWK7]|nr:hypothetical protein RRSWK_02360 [Rhodopirellula sp. SWK7]
MGSSGTKLLRIRMETSALTNLAILLKDRFTQHNGLTEGEIARCIASDTPHAY